MDQFERFTSLFPASDSLSSPFSALRSPLSPQYNHEDTHDIQPQQREHVPLLMQEVRERKKEKKGKKLTPSIRLACPTDSGRVNSRTMRSSVDKLLIFE